MNVDILQVAAQFAVDGVLLGSAPIERGHIHATFRVDVQTGAAMRSCLLQRINTQIFRDAAAMMRNIVLVTDHLRARLQQRGVPDAAQRVLRVVLSRAGETLVVLADGANWRMYEFVEGAHPVPDAPQLAEIYEAARAFGQFIALLADLPQQQLTETLPNFHHGPLRLAALREAVARDACGRAADVCREIEFMSARAGLLAEPQRLLTDEGLPLRILHNDTKCNNVLIDDATGTARCVIDLDTVMPGLALYDLGDLVRTTATGRPEDEPDLRRIDVDFARVEQSLRGFVAGAEGRFEPRELRSLVIGPAYMALIMAVRFLTDHLQGDTYYRICHAGHNLQRCRAQLALVESLENSQTRLAALVEELVCVWERAHANDPS